MTHPITPPGAAHPPPRPDQAGPGTSRSGAATEWTEGKSWTVPLPYDTPPLSLNQRLSRWVHKAIKDALQDAVRWRIRAEKIHRCDRIRVELNYLPARGGRRDADNLVGTLKPSIDCCVLEGIVRDDTGSYVEWPPPVIHPPGAKPFVEGRLWLTITELRPAIKASQATGVPGSSQAGVSARSRRTGAPGARPDPAGGA